MNNEILYVFINCDYIGKLFHDELGGIEFQYDKSAKIQLSLSLPIREEKYSNKECIGFFNGILPEGDNLRKYIAKKYGINPNNDFAILKAIGYDCAGAISFLKTKKNDLKEWYEIEGEVLSDNKLEKLIKELPEKPLGTGVKDLRLSLAGTQDKTAVLLIDNKIALPSKLIPTTSIIKPQIRNYKESVENEYICLKTAQKLGLKVVNVQIRKVNDTKFLLIERYDRKIENNKIKRLHQEDFCQISNIPSAYKYEKEGGLGFKKCFDILRKTSNPPKNIKEFSKLLIFNLLIGNNDAHGKNFSLLYNALNIELAPAYDILCTSVYPKISKKMAMKVDKYYRLSDLSENHLKNLVKECGIGYPYFKKLILEQTESLPELVKEVSQSFENTIGKSIIKVVEKNCKKMNNILKGE